MKAIILDGSYENDTTAGRVYSELANTLGSSGWEVEHILLRERKIGNCAGDFFCWVRSPGICNVDDDNRDIAEMVVASDLMVFMSPITFGGYSSALKRMVDHLIQNVSPFFSTIHGETHHQKRYSKYPAFWTIGWMEAADAGAENVFRFLSQRNAINFFAQKVVTSLVLASQLDGEIQAALRAALQDLGSTSKSRMLELPQIKMESLLREPTAPIRSAVLLVGSPRTSKSTSASLGGYLFDQLSERSIQTETIYLHTILRSPQKLEAMFAAVDEADLVLLAFPLYVDSLPAPVIDALERIAAHRRERGMTTRQTFAALSNCGFPEAAHTAAALTICSLFAQQAGFTWGGSLAFGSGEMVHGTALVDLDGRAIPIRRALELTASALADGKPIPQQASDLLAKPILPAWIMNLMGGFGWKQQAKRYNMQSSLKRKVYREAK